MAGGVVFDPGNFFQMSQVILWNGPVPADDVVENRVGANAQGLAKIAAHALQQAVIAPGGDFGPVPAAGHGTKEDHASGGSAGKNRRTPLHAQNIMSILLWRNIPEARQIVGHVALAKTD